MAPGPAPQRILLIGTARWAPSLRRHWAVTRVKSGRAARAHSGQSYAVIIVDAASMYTTGARICRDLRAIFPQAILVNITAEEYAPAADVCLTQPLSARGLVGVVSRLLRGDPRDIVACGPFSLNRTTRILSAHGGAHRLNPKLSRLLDLLLSNPNRTLSRSLIMRQVWDTDYLGDTRTLNVHIRRARMLLEREPRNPVFLITVRGVGYRLDLPIAPEEEREAQTDLDAE